MGGFGERAADGSCQEDRLRIEMAEERKGGVRGFGSPFGERGYREVEQGEKDKAPR